MKIKKGYKLKSISGRQTVIADKRIHKGFSNVIVLNETAVFLWKLVEDREVAREEMPDLLEKEFNMSKLLALSNTDVFVRTMVENGIIEE